MTKSFTLSMNGSFDGVVEDHNDEALSAPGSNQEPGWTASDVADYNREQRLHGLRRTPELALLPVSEATLAARGIDNSCGWTASDVAEHNREKRLHGHSVH
jgi:hypothetical protein